MAQVTISDNLMDEARALLDGEGITDDEIVSAAVGRWVDDKKNSRELDTLFDECRGKLHWDPAFAGVGPDYKRPLWS